MARLSPLLRLHQQAEASLAVYGPASDVQTTDPSAVRDAVEVVESYGELELEYAAIRKACVVLDQPHRGLIEVTGADRLEFLNRMLTQELKGMRAGEVRHSFWLNRKGRIDSDLQVVELGDRTLLECDVHAVDRTIATLSAYVITEDVTLTDLTPRHHCLAVHGPTAPLLLAAAANPVLSELGDRRCEVVNFPGVGAEGGGADVIACRDDSTGEFGVEMWVPVERVVSVFQSLVELGHAHNGDESAKAGSLAARVRLRPAGWHAWNIARIEAGVPVYNLDFGSESLPAESGVIDDRVSFTKGCYLGQEIVARMHARGHPKQTLVAIKFESITSPRVQQGQHPLPAQPTTGTGLSLEGDSTGEAIGVITSSTLAPMVSSAPIAFAQVKFANARPGVRVVADAEGIQIRGEVQGSLRLLPAR